MAPRNAKRGKACSHSAKVASESKAATIAFATSIDPSSQNFLLSFEEDVKVICAYCEDQDVDEQVTLFVLDLG